MVREPLQAWLGKRGAWRGETLQELAASLSTPRHLAPFYCARVLLDAGHVRQARTLAAEWSDPVVRRRLERLTATGLWGHGGDRRFVGQPFDDDSAFGGAGAAAVRDRAIACVSFDVLLAAVIAARVYSWQQSAPVSGAAGLVAAAPTD